MINIRKDFPYLKSKELDSIIYFDNASTSQKPYQVIEAISNYYAYHNAPVHRGIYSKSEKATILYEESRETVSKFIGADKDEIIFTKGTTEGINFIAQSWASYNLKPGDEVIISHLEHHSNILPWIRLMQEKDIVLKYIPITNNFELDYKAYTKLLSNKTKLVSITSCSNAVGSITDLDFIIKHAKVYNTKVLVDAAQTIGHRDFNLKNLNIDFLAFSGHKILGPTGIGVLYISKDMQKEVRPYQLGGGMVLDVNDYDFISLNPPNCYQAGTPPIAQVIGLSQAIKYISDNIDYDLLKKHESALCAYLIQELSKFDHIKILGPKDQLSNSGHIVSFVSTLYHPHDIAFYLDQFNIAVRAGNHCAQPLFKNIGINGSVRASFYVYNTFEEVETLVKALNELFRK